MNAREMTLLIGCLVTLVVVLRLLAGWGRSVAARRDRRLELLVEALRDPALDAATRSELARALVRDHQGVLGWLWQRLRQPMLWRVLWFGAGWITMLVAGALLAMQGLGLNVLRSWDVPGVVLTAVAGFAMVTLPLALRELLRRERAPASR